MPGLIERIRRAGGVSRPAPVAAEVYQERDRIRGLSADQIIIDEARSLVATPRVWVDSAFPISSDSTPRKEAKPWPNVANGIDNWLRDKWPELVTIPGLWFTGSTVWSHLYAQFPPVESDLDIFILPWPNGPQEAATKRLLIEQLRIRVDGRRTYLGATRWQTEKGQVDFWVSQYHTVHQQLLAYPSESHAQCRAAYSFAAGLVALPNEKAL